MATMIGTEVISQYMTFTLVARKPKTNVWEVLNRSSRDPLGVIAWYGPWRQYVLMPAPDVVFNKGCLERIIQFIATEAKGG